MIGVTQGRRKTRWPPTALIRLGGVQGQGFVTQITLEAEKQKRQRKRVFQFSDPGDRIHANRVNRKNGSRQPRARNFHRNMNASARILLPDLKNQRSNTVFRIFDK